MNAKETAVFIQNLGEVFADRCRPICRDTGISLAALSILMFLAENPEQDRAADIARCCTLKPNIVSYNVDKLVNEGFLMRIPLPDNRRSIKLCCTDKAEPIIERGKNAYCGLLSSLTDGFSEEEKVQLNFFADRLSANMRTAKSASEKAEGGYKDA